MKVRNVVITVFVVIIHAILWVFKGLFFLLTGTAHADEPDQRS